ncbi:MAG: ABC transporter substrate-binding protein, partial [Betaproteobacteria bacterium]|nr:ABC transporter substrate-binding protein [Betaproteobacteria bacterium]NDC68738.1 ABC transporter substrate-binding protein [Betaproteobacteria bacterium]
AIDTAAHKRFAEAYQQRYKDYPRLGSVVGYSTIKALAAGLKAAGSADTEKLVNAMQGLEFETPFGAARFRAIDHQSTMGAYVGRIAVQSGKGVMQQIRYADGAKHLPGDDQVRQLRPKP